MLKALNPLKAEWYTPMAERGERDATEFLLRPLSGVELFEVELYRDENNQPAVTERGGRALLKYGLQGWKNFNDDAGPVEFNKDRPETNLDRLPGPIASELAVELWVRSRLTDEQRKNLLLPPTSAPTPSDTSAGVADGGGTATSETPQDSLNGT